MGHSTKYGFSSPAGGPGDTNLLLDHLKFRAAAQEPAKAVAEMRPPVDSLAPG